MGSPGPFVDFIAERTIDTIEMVRTSLGVQTGRTGPALDYIRRELTGPGDDRNVASARLRALIEAELPAVLASFQPPEGVALEFVPRPKKRRTDTVRGYLPTVETFAYAMRVEGRPGAVVRRGFSIWVVEDPRASPEMVVVSVDLKTHSWLTGLLAKDIELLAWRVHQQSFD